MKIAPAAPTIHCPPGQPSTPAADLCGVLELWLDEPSRMATASAHIDGVGDAARSAAMTRPILELSPPPSGPCPKNACTNRHSA